jgi:hypothetical protein
VFSEAPPAALTALRRHSVTASADCAMEAGGRIIACLDEVFEAAAQARTAPPAPTAVGTEPPVRAAPPGYPLVSGADGSVCQSPNSLPCGSVHVANQPMRGTGIASSARPPSSFTRAAPALMSSTSK